MEKTTIESRFGAAARFAKRIYGRGFQAKIVKACDVKTSHISEVVNKDKGASEGLRRKILDEILLIVPTVPAKTYEDFLNLGSWILAGHDPQQWQSANNSVPCITTVASDTTSNIFPDSAVIKKIPVISWVRAGGWQDIDEQFHPSDADDWIHTTATSHPKAFALVVKGDSMEPLFLEGETIIVDPGRTAINGSYVIAKTEDTEATFKQLVVDGPNVYLRPLNTVLYKQWDMTGVEFRIIGVVVAKEQRY